MYKEKKQYFSCIFILKTEKFLAKLFQFSVANVKNRKNSSYRHKIELSLRFSGKNTYFRQLFRHFLFLFYVILHAKKHFL